MKGQLKELEPQLRSGAGGHIAAARLKQLIDAVRNNRGRVARRLLSRYFCRIGRRRVRRVRVSPACRRFPDSPTCPKASAAKQRGGFRAACQKVCELLGGDGLKRLRGELARKLIQAEKARGRAEAKRVKSLVTVQQKEAKRRIEALKRLTPDAASVERIMGTLHDQAKMISVGEGPVEVRAQGKSRTIELDHYHIDHRRVTAKAYRTCVTSGDCTPRGRDDQCHSSDSSQAASIAANCVTFYQAKAYCLWAGKRLPTGAEWQRVASFAVGKQFGRGWYEWTSDSFRTNRVLRGSASITASQYLRTTSQTVWTPTTTSHNTAFRCVALKAETAQRRLLEAKAKQLGDRQRAGARKRHAAQKQKLNSRGCKLARARRNWCASKHLYDRARRKLARQHQIDRRKGWKNMAARRVYRSHLRAYDTQMAQFRAEIRRLKGAVPSPCNFNSLVKLNKRETAACVYREQNP